MADGRPAFTFTFLRDEAHNGKDGTYIGQFKKQKRDGIGSMVWSNGSKYEGEWKEGRQEGHGILVLACKDYYCGDWHAGKAHGKGKYRHSNG